MTDTPVRTTDELWAELSDMIDEYGSERERSVSSYGTTDSGWAREAKETRAAIAAKIAQIRAIAAAWKPEHALIAKLERVTAIVCWQCRSVTYSEDFWSLDPCDTCGAETYVLPVVFRPSGAVRDGGALDAWRPIESAPRDGGVILVARDMGEPWGWVRGYARWESVVAELAYGTDPVEIDGWISHGFHDPPGELGLAHPTHWMALPEPPREQGAVPVEPWGGHVEGCKFTTTDGWQCMPGCRVPARGADAATTGED